MKIVALKPYTHDIMDCIKRRQTFRVYSTGQQEKDLSHLFGYTRVVRNHFTTLSGGAGNE